MFRWTMSGYPNYDGYKYDGYKYDGYKYDGYDQSNDYRENNNEKSIKIYLKNSRIKI